MHWADTIVYGNTLLSWGLAFGTTVILFAGLRVVKSVALRNFGKLAQRTANTWDDLLLAVLERTTGLFLAVVAVYAGISLLDVSAGIGQLAARALIIMFLLQVGIWSDTLVVQAVRTLARKKSEEDASSVAMITVMGFVGRLAAWSVVALLALDNLGFDITALVAGMGIGGVAVALAAQNVLGDLFASISIVLDQPFVVGDFIIVGDLMGTVEYVGIKTTRVRSLSGEQLVFANNDLLSSRIRNFKRMYERRVVFSIGVVYQTALDKLSSIPDMLRQIIESQPPERTRFDRAHFQKYSDFALVFEIVYYVKSPDYNLYMDIQQAINLEIFRRFEEHGIEFAYPTQRLFLERAEPAAGNDEN